MTREELRRRLDYNPCTGIFTWKIHWAGKRRPRAGNSVRYCRIVIKGKSHSAARLAWFYVYGYWPEVVDHIDRNPRNNSIWNLANGTQSDNMRNTATYQGGPLGRRRKQDYFKGRVKALTFYSRN